MSPLTQGLNYRSACDSLPNHVVSADTINTFKNRLDKFWSDQEMLYDYNTDLHGIGNRSLLQYSVTSICDFTSISRIQRPLRPASVFSMMTTTMMMMCQSIRQSVNPYLPSRILYVFTPPSIQHVCCRALKTNNEVVYTNLKGDIQDEQRCDGCPQCNVDDDKRSISHISDADPRLRHVVLHSSGHRCNTPVITRLSLSTVSSRCLRSLPLSTCSQLAHV